MRLLVVPSNRADMLARFLNAWRQVDHPGWDTVCVIEDGPTRSFDVKADLHVSWAEIEKVVGDDAWVFSRRDSAVRCFGLLLGYHFEAEAVLTLDDDCLPDRGRDPHGRIFAQHLRAMDGHRRWVSSVPGQRTRGLPYRDLGRLDNVMANVGLWSVVADWDAVQSVLGPPEGSFEPPAGNWVVPRGQYVPVCGMNLCVRHEALPLFYFPPMGEGQPYRRFDDIWAGVIAKRLLDHLGWHLSVGEPFVRHLRASDPFDNLVKEAPGIKANETFYRVVDEVPLTTGQKDPVLLVGELGSGLEVHHDPYIRKLGQALQVWSRLCDEVLSWDCV